MKSKEVLIVKQDLVASKVLIHSHGNGNGNNIYKRISSNRRIKTTPTHSQTNASQIEDITKLI